METRLLSEVQGDANSDRYSREVELDTSRRAALLLVADGMGGHAGGARASRLALETVAEEMGRAAGRGDPGWESRPGALAEHLSRSMETANRRVYEEARSEAALTGMGTTLTAAVLVGSSFVIAQVGDSRAYRYRPDALEQLTRDQSMVQELLDAGTMTPEEARTSPRRNLILQAIGTQPELEPVITRGELEPGEALLLCSDGLSGLLSDGEMLRILQGNGSPADRCRELVKAANRAGGQDNITVVLAESRAL